MSTRADAVLVATALVTLGVAGGIALEAAAGEAATVTATAPPSTVTVTRPAVTLTPKPAPTVTVTRTVRAARAATRVNVPERPAGQRVTGTVAIYQAYARDRVSAAQWPCLRALVQRESSWRPTAVNGSHYGLFQMRGLAHDTGWKHQVVRGLSYIDYRYGTPCAALRHSDLNGWY